MTRSEVSLDELEAALRRLPARRRKDVLLFIEFLEYETVTDDDRSDDDDLWKAALAHQEYRRAHAAEQPEEYDSSEAFLQATADL